MSNVQQIIKRNAYAFAAGLFLLAAAVPSIVLPRLASAAQVQSRSIQLSTAAPSQSAIYNIKFNVASNYTMRGIIVDFCDGPAGSPIIGSSNCTLPGGNMVVGTTIDSMTANSVDVASGWSAATLNSGRTLSLTNATGTAVTSGHTIDIAVGGFTNTSATGTFYARILTYNTDSISGYTETNTLTYQDSGGVALSINPNIGVTATVQETLMFCVRGDEPTSQCGGGSPQAPNVVLGTGNPRVLSTNTVDTAPVYFQLSTNAASGAIVRLKGDTLKSGSNSIPAIGAVSSALGSPGNEGFGFRVGDPAPLGTAEGAVAAVAPYENGSQWAFDSAETTSTYGDIIASSTGPVYDINKLIEVAARAKGSTPAGVYTTSLSVVAVGTY